MLEVDRKYARGYIVRTAAREVFVYVLHLLAGAIGSILAALLLTSPLFALFILRGDRGGRLIDVLLDGPFFPLHVLCALALGYFLNRKLRSRSAMWIWILPLMNLLYSVFTWNSYGSPQSHWADVWDNFFGCRCTSSECLYQLLITLPFYTSVAYSLSAFCAKFQVGRRVTV